MMELENVKKVEEIKSAEILNFYLEKGWNLIATEKRIYGGSEAYEQRVFSLLLGIKMKLRCILNIVTRTIYSMLKIHT